MKNKKIKNPDCPDCGEELELIEEEDNALWAIAFELSEIKEILAKQFGYKLKK